MNHLQLTTRKIEKEKEVDSTITSDSILGLSSRDELGSIGGLVGIVCPSLYMYLCTSKQLFSPESIFLAIRQLQGEANLLHETENNGHSDHVGKIIPEPIKNLSFSTYLQ